MSRPSRLRLALALSAVLLAPAALAAQAGGAAGRRCILQFQPLRPESPPTTVSQQQPSGRSNVFQSGGVRYLCENQPVTMEADSAAYYGDLATLYLVGNVHYVDGGAVLDANQLTYYQNEEWLVAQGDVRARMQNGSTMRGPMAEYYRAIPGVRPVERMVATGRPTFLLTQPDSAGQSRPPVEVVGDRVTAEGDSLVYAGGRVVITRPDLEARADSAVMDEGREFARLMRSPQITGRGERPFTLSGELIDLFSRERQLERVLSSGSARVVSEELDLRSDTLDLRVVENELQRLYAWGPSRARATSPGRDITADSLDVRLPEQRLREVHAIGGARIETAPDSVRIRSEERDWLAGDTIIAHFDSLAAPQDSAETPPLESVLALGGARSYQQIPPDTGSTECPSIHYVRGRTIRATFAEGDPRRVDVVAPDSGMTTGVYLECGAAQAPGTPAGARPGTPARPSPGGVRPAPPPRRRR